eukprot:scaffold180396_cov27-Tisochrysis_lutea.AAC.1
MGYFTPCSANLPWSLNLDLNWCAQSAETRISHGPDKLFERNSGSRSRPSSLFRCATMALKASSSLIDLDPTFRGGEGHYDLREVWPVLLLFCLLVPSLGGLLSESIHRLRLCGLVSWLCGGAVRRGGVLLGVGFFCSSRPPPFGALERHLASVGCVVG